MLYNIIGTTPTPSPIDIRHLRAEAGMTQEQIGEILGGLPARRVSEYENGHVHMSQAMWAALQLSLGRHPDLEVRRKKRGA